MVSYEHYRTTRKSRVARRYFPLSTEGRVKHLGYFHPRHRDQVRKHWLLITVVDRTPSTSHLQINLS